jgi:type II secretory pathway pseudopilin PulG
MKHAFHPPSRRAGFTLVELALTALVIGLGLLAVLGLGRLGMQAAVDTETDARCALLADDILATLRTASDDVCRTGGPSAFVVFWETLQNDASAGVNFPAAGEPAMTNRLDGVIKGGGASSRAQFTALTPLSDPVDEWSAQFWLSIELESTLSARTNEANQVQLSLNIRPDAYGMQGAARTFYTHIQARTLWP